MQARRQKIFRSLTRLEDLRALIVDYEDLDSECFDIICRNFKKLVRLELRQVTKLTDEDGAKLCLLKDLSELHFQKAVGFTDRAFEKGLGSSAMKSLVMADSPLTDRALMSIAAHHARLKSLNIQGCKNITDAGLALLLEREPLLESLQLYSCISLTDEFLRALENLCPRLRYLQIWACRISTEAKEFFERRRPKVRTRPSYA